MRTRFLSFISLLAAAVMVIQGCSSVQDLDTPRNALRARNIPFDTKSFMKAASEGRDDVLELFLAGGMEINTLDDGTALTSAVSSNQKKTVDFLIARGADPNLCSYLGSPLYLAAKLGYFDVAAKLVQAGADAEYEKNDGSTPLLESVRNDHLEISELLIKAGADPDAGDSFYKRTPVFLAAANGSADLILMLCENGADPHEPDTYGVTPLDKAAESGSREAVKVLIEKGAAMSDDNGSACRAVLQACSTNNTELLGLMKEKGLDLNSRAPEGIPLLSWCIKNGYYQSAKFLLESGADRNLADSHGEVPLDYALKGTPEFLAYFRSSAPEKAAEPEVKKDVEAGDAAGQTSAPK